MPYTLRNLCTDALIEIGVVGADDDAPEDSEIQTALRYAQLMANAQSADPFNLYTVDYEPFVLVNGQQQYTIGPSGADFTAQRPMWVEDVRVRPAGSDNDLPMHRYTRKEWYAETLKSLTNGYPYKWLYEMKTGALGRFTFWPIPTTAPTVLVAVPQSLASPDTLDTALTFPPGLQEAWRCELAKKIYRPMWNQAAPPDVVENARKAMEVYRQSNDEGPPPARSEFAGGGGYYDIYTNQYRDGQ